MGTVTFQILNGFERGKIYSEIPAPFTIGREEENTIRLNDERVSRFHCKIQDDEGRIILTDLDSTNGTRVNGTPVQMRVLTIGDQVAIGRSLLLFGSPQQLVAKRALVEQKTHDLGQPDQATMPANREHSTRNENEAEKVLDDGIDLEELDNPFPDGPPPVPAEARPLQVAAWYDVMTYLHQQLSIVTDAAEEDAAHSMVISWQDWQRLLQLQMELCVYQRRLAEPTE